MKTKDIFHLEVVLEANALICKLLNNPTNKIVLNNNLECKYINSKGYLAKIKKNNFSYSFLTQNILESRAYLIYLLNEKYSSIKTIRKNIIRYYAYSLLFIYKKEQISNSQIKEFLYYFIKNDPEMCVSNLNKTKLISILKKDNKNIMRATKLKLMKFSQPFLTENSDFCLQKIKKHRSKINFMPINTKTKKYNYIFGITADYLKYSLIKKYLLNYFCIINKTKTEQIVNYLPKKKDIIYQFVKNFNCDPEFINFIKNLPVNSVNLCIIHGDLHLKNIIYNKNWYIIDLNSINYGPFEKELATTGISIYLKFGFPKFRNFIQNIKNKHKYDKNVLFIEMFSKLNKFNTDINPITEILDAINNWKQIYAVL